MTTSWGFLPCRVVEVVVGTPCGRFEVGAVVGGGGGGTIVADDGGGGGGMFTAMEAEAGAVAEGWAGGFAADAPLSRSANARITSDATTAAATAIIAKRRRAVCATPTPFSCSEA